LKSKAGIETFLLHSRFRPADRADVIGHAVIEPVVADQGGRILIATQVVEAGVDISAATLITDAAPWSSIVQRAGRCNRAGDLQGARLLWTDAPRPEPYDKDDLAASVAALRSLEGEPVTSTRLRELGRDVAEVEPVVAVLRRRDLVGLFDTSPDLVGNDIDIARFIRADGDVDVQVAWRYPAPAGHAGEPFLGGPLRADEQCRVSINHAREWLRKEVTAWVPDHLGRRGSWRPLDPFQLRPGATVVVDVSAGGYDPERGWDGTTKRPVPVIEPLDHDQADEEDVLTPIDETSGGDPGSFAGGWVGLNDHLKDAEQAARALLSEAGMHELTESQCDAVVRAAALHDVGKAHPVFQETLVRSAGADQREAAEQLMPLAKSGGSNRATHRRPHFRHELVSALLLKAHGDVFLPDAADADLVRYLVAAHHGRVRLAIRSIPGEEPPPESRGARVALGVVDGEVVPAILVGDVRVPETTLHLDAMSIGGPDAWTTMALRLRDRPDLGPFRLATLEALVRVADWRASAAPSTTFVLESQGAAR
jgi:CRISPR-associated endonuclease/helicase Cas3